MALAAQLGIGADLVRALEHGATSRIAALPVDVVLRLADTLHLAPADLFTPHPPDPTTALASSTDDRAIEAALLAHGDTITIDQLAEALGWPLGRLEDALAGLDRRLQPTGTRLCRTGWHRYRIQPNHRALPEDAWDRLDQAHHEHAGLNLHTATLLGLLLRGFPLACRRGKATTACGGSYAASSSSTATSHRFVSAPTSATASCSRSIPSSGGAGEACRWWVAARPRLHPTGSCAHSTDSFLAPAR